MTETRITWRWAGGVALLLLYVGALGYLGSLQAEDNPGGAPLLPGTLIGLLTVVGSELLIFAIIFGLFCWLTRPTREDLLFNARGGMKVLGRGVLYSIGLRIFIAICLAIFVGLTTLFRGNRGSLAALRPKTEALVDFAVIANDPIYLMICLTLVSFLLGGLREELWRAGILAGVQHLFPNKGKKRIQLLGVILAAIVFGLGHLTQGWGGVFITALLGLGLGYIMVRRQSLWEPVLAHGFFDATTFAFLYLLGNFAPEALKNV